MNKKTLFLGRLRLFGDWHEAVSLVRSGKGTKFVHCINANSPKKKFPSTGGWGSVLKFYMKKIMVI